MHSTAVVKMQKEMSVAYRQKLLGTRHAVLFEETDGEFFTGHAPNYVKVYAKGENLHNEIRFVEVTEVYQDGMFGKLIYVAMARERPSLPCVKGGGP